MLDIILKCLGCHADCRIYRNKNDDNNNNNNRRKSVKVPHARIHTLSQQLNLTSAILEYLATILGYSPAILEYYYIATILGYTSAIT